MTDSNLYHHLNDTNYITAAIPPFFIYRITPVSLIYKCPFSWIMYLFLSTLKDFIPVCYVYFSGFLPLFMCLQLRFDTCFQYVDFIEYTLFLVSS